MIELHFLCFIMDFVLSCLFFYCYSLSVFGNFAEPTYHVEPYTQVWSKMKIQPKHWSKY
jgi:hypothetical protein